MLAATILLLRFCCSDTIAKGLAERAPPQEPEPIKEERLKGGSLSRSDPTSFNGHGIVATVALGYL
eukprot:2663828-Amphidinium_carterae.1